MKKLLLVLFLLTAANCVYAQDRGLQVLAAENLGGQANVGKQYALFIAIDAYRYWPALKKPVADAGEIRSILKRDYYIDEVIELYNGQATKQNIIRTFTDLQSKLGVHDSLFIYYAGHGHLDKNSDAGFWIPVDGGTDQYSQENWLPNSQIRGFISRFKTIHVFMVSDACFSGDILNTTRALPPQIDNAYYRKAYALTSRQVLTLGSSETVPDQSEFSTALINCLRKNTSPLLDPLGIYSDVRLSVSKTTPLYGTLTAASHQEGATFLFFRRQASVTPQPVTPPPPRTTTTAVGSIAVSSDIAGVVMIDGEATGTRIKAGGTVTVSNVGAGSTEVAVKGDDGKITKAPQMVMVVQGQTVAAAVKAPVPNTPVQPAPAPAPVVQPTPAPAVQPVAPPIQPAPDNMVWIQGGTFQMGSNNSTKDVEPVHTVTLSGFYMGKYEVTQKEYQSIMGTNPSKFKEDNLPIENVSWYDVLIFCNKLSMTEGLSPAYSINNSTNPSNWGSVPTSRNSTWDSVIIVSGSNGYRLPTEAQWEYAARGGNGSPGNYMFSGSNNIDDVAWYSSNSGKSTHAVGTKKPNGLGLYDMSGNVSEWCWDWYGAYSGSAQTDPTGAASGDLRVTRGMNWDAVYGSPLLSVYRGNYYPYGRRDSIGFRLVRP